MGKLTQNWLTDGLIDFEYKKYILLDYLQQVSKSFSKQELYPTFSDLIFHYNNLKQVKEGKELLYQNFPKEISKEDFQRLKLSYRQIVEDDETMTELTEIIHFALPKFEHLLENGKEIYESIAEKIDVEPIGIIPLVKDEGYLFVQQHLFPEFFIYQYQLSIFSNSSGKYRGLNLTFLEKMRKNVGQTYENVKLRLIKENSGLPNPATFLLVSKIPCPFEETLLPVSKRVFIRHLASSTQSYSN